MVIKRDFQFFKGGYIFSNWRRNKKEAGPNILEKCCHGNGACLYKI